MDVIACILCAEHQARAARTVQRLHRQVYGQLPVRQLFVFVPECQNRRIAARRGQRKLAPAAAGRRQRTAAHGKIVFLLSIERIDRHHREIAVRGIVRRGGLVFRLCKQPLKPQLRLFKHAPLDIVVVLRIFQICDARAARVLDRRDHLARTADRNRRVLLAVQDQNRHILDRRSSRSAARTRHRNRRRKGIRVARDEIPRAITAERLTHQIDAVGIHAEFLLQLADQTHQELGALRFLHACIIAAIRPVHIDPLVARGQLRNQHDALVLLVADERRDERRKIFQLFLVIRAARTRAVEIDQHWIRLAAVIICGHVHPVIQAAVRIRVDLFIKFIQFCDRGQRVFRCFPTHTLQLDGYRNHWLSIFGNE